MSDWYCESCMEFVDFHRPANYDGPDHCPECRDIDSLIGADEVAERAYENFLDSYYGDSAPVTLEEKQNEARKLK